MKLFTVKLTFDGKKKEKNATNFLFDTCHSDLSRSFHFFIVSKGEEIQSFEEVPK